MKHWPSDRVGKAKRDVCVWREEIEGGWWQGTCGLHWVLEEGTPELNGMNFCPMCGKRLKQKGGEK